MFLTQSQNSSAKIALCVDEFLQNFIESKMKHNLAWNQLENAIMYTSHDAFTFHSFLFNFRMIYNAINNLIPTGIMKHLIENYYT